MQTSYNFLIAEDVELNTTLGTILATDIDEDRNGNIEFVIVAGDTERFFLISSQQDDVQTHVAMVINSQVCGFSQQHSLSY